MRRRAQITRPFGAIACSLFALVATGCPSAWKLEAVNGAPPTITNDTWSRIECTRQAFDGAAPIWQNAMAAHFHCEGASTPDEIADCADAPGHRGAHVVAHPERLRSLASFIDLSDAQLKEHEIHMEGALGDELNYDGIQSASNRDELLEENDDAVLLSMVFGINAMSKRLPEPPALEPNRWAGLPSPRRPAFVIHTGDAVDSGMFSELLQFIGAMDQLDIPYFNAIGNHDNLFFGTIPADLVSGMNVVAPYVPILTTARFMRYHSREGADYDPTLPMPRQRAADQRLDPSAWRLIAPTPGSALSKNVVCDSPDSPCEFQGSRYHGFDFACRDNVLTTNDLCHEARGYYDFDLSVGAPGSGVVLRVIVLNTAEILPTSIAGGGIARSRANMLPAQFEWLERELGAKDANNPAAPKFFIVLGHHDLSSFLDSDQEKRLESLLFNEPRVLAYVTAHTHVDNVVEYKRPNGESFWEIIAGSTLVYPQLGRLIELLLDDDAHEIVLRVATFRQALGDRAASLWSSPAAKDGCPTPADGDAATVCTPLAPSTSYCQHLADRAYFGRVGAARDVDSDRRDERDAVDHVSGLLPVYRLAPGDADLKALEAAAAPLPLSVTAPAPPPSP